MFEQHGARNGEGQREGQREEEVLIWPLLRITPAAGDDDTPLAFGAQPSMRLRVSKRFAAIDAPGGLSIRLAAGTLELCLTPANVRALTSIAGTYESNCAWVAALKKQVDDGRTSDDMHGGPATVAEMLAELRGILRAPEGEADATSQPANSSGERAVGSGRQAPHPPQ